MSKPLPLQILRKILKTSVDAMIGSEHEVMARGLATTLERHAVELRQRYGGKSLMTPGARLTDRARSAKTSAKKSEAPALTRIKRLFGHCSPCNKLYLGREDCTICGGPLESREM